MAALGILALGFAPGVFWLWIIYQRDRYLPSPVALVVRTFLFGVAVAVPISFVEMVLTGFGLIDPFQPDLPRIVVAYVAFVVAGFTEELGKFLVVRRSLYPSPYFSEPMDGLIFGSAVALGFASLENVSYMVEYGWAVILVRGPLSTLGHVLFSAPWAYALGRQKQAHVSRGLHPFTWAGLIAAMALHGLFDFFLFSEGAQRAWAILAFLAALAWFFFLLRRAERVSAVQHKTASVLLQCTHCGSRCGSLARYCPGCGHDFPRDEAGPLRVCARCGTAIKREYGFCPSCGSRLDRRALEPYLITPGPSQSGGVERQAP
jgi:RsiW-degrading membrane proteinase PrsW (M82 family)